MDPISAPSLLSPSTGAGTDSRTGVAALGTEDFIQLLVTQLTNQDPLEPTGNEELLAQISSIREIELSTTLTESLSMLTSQQRFASASTLIGQYVTGPSPGTGPASDGALTHGIVVGVRFAEGGRPILLLSNGIEIPLENVTTIESPLRAAEALIGRTIVGMDRRDPSEPEVVEGVVTGVRTDEQGEALLELDSGSDLRLRDVVNVTSSATG